MTLHSGGEKVIYRSKLNPKINRNFEIFTGPDFLATITQHIPDKGAQMIRYYGWYSNKMRGQRHRVPNGGCSGGSVASAVHAATACEAAFQKVAGCHSQSLAHPPADLPALPAPDASACGD